MSTTITRVGGSTGVSGTSGAERNIAADGATTGAANNATIIQAAIDAVATAGGGTVVIPKGTWLTGPLKMKTRVRLLGEGPASRLKLINGANAHMISLDTAQVEQVEIENLCLDGNGANQTTGDIVHVDNTGYDNGVAQPSLGDPNHYLHRVLIVNAKSHGLYTSGAFSQSHFDDVFVYLSGLNNFRIESPDNFLFNCVSAKSGNEGFYFASNSNHGLNLKSWLSGAVTATSGQGYIISGVDRIDLIGCEAQDNRAHGLSLVTTTQANIVGFRSNRNGLGAAGTGGVGDGMFGQNVTNSRIDLVAYDHNNGGYKQRWGYNLGSGNSGNVVTLTLGPHQDNSVPGIGSWGPGSQVTMTWLGQPVAQPAPPMAIATAQTGSYTLLITDAGTEVPFNSATAATCTIPTNATTPFPIGTTIDLAQLGTGQVTVAAASGATVNGRGGALKLAGQHAQGRLRKTGTDTWRLSGDITV